jgi:hypothetical protein
MFEDSKTYVREQDITDNVEQMASIVNSKSPFSQIQKLPDMCDKFVKQYGALLEKEAKEMEPIVADDYKKVMDILETKPFADAFWTKFAARFEEIKDKLATSHEIAAVKNIRLESDTLKLRCLDEIADYEAIYQPALEEPSVPTSTSEGGSPAAPMVEPTVARHKKRKNMSISNVAGARTYSIENEQDIDQFLAEMKLKLMKELDEDTIITLS